MSSARPRDERTNTDLEEVIRVFFGEAEENLESTVEALLGLELAPDDAELIGSAFRAIHTLKGNAVALGFERVAETAHGLEDTLDQLRQRRRAVDSALVTELLRSLDVLRKIVAEARVASGEARDRAGTMRVGLEKLDRMLTIAGEVAIARGRLRTLLESPGASVAAALDPHLEADRLYVDLQDEIMRVRLVPLRPLFRQQARAVRDLAVATGKRAKLVGG